MPNSLAASAAPELKETEIDKDDPLKTAAGYEASEVEMGASESVEDRISGIIKDDSPLMQVARTNAAQASNRKGTLNSSMAVGAAQKSVIEAATPIATKDAETSASFKLSNQNSRNNAGQFNAGELNKQRGVVYAGNQELASIAAQGEEERKNISANLEGESRLQSERAEIDKQLIDAEGNVKMDLLIRQGEIDSELADLAFEYDLALQAEKAEIDKRLIDADGQVKIDLQERQAVIDREQEAIRQTYAERLKDQQAKIDLALQKADGQTRQRLQQMSNNGARAIAQLQADASLEQIRARGWIDGVLQNSSQIHAENLQNLTGEQAAERERIRGDYDTIINADRNAAALMSQHDAGVSNILNNPELTTSQKNNLIRKQNEITDAALAVIGAHTDTDYQELLQFDSLDPTYTPEQLANITSGIGGADFNINYG